MFFFWARSVKSRMSSKIVSVSLQSCDRDYAHSCRPQHYSDDESYERYDPERPSNYEEKNAYFDAFFVALVFSVGVGNKSLPPPLRYW